MMEELPGHESQLCTSLFDSMISDITWNLEVGYGGVSHHENEQMVQISVLFICFQDRLLTIYQQEGVVRLK